MPDTLSLSSGITLGLVAGIVSGVCYLVANGLVGPRNETAHRKKCLPDNPDEVCRGCGGDQRGGIIPCICNNNHHKPVKFESGAWFLRQVQQALSLMPWTLSTERLELIEEECEGDPGEGPAQRELRNVREFLEAIAAKLTGGTLEGTRVAPLYDHPACIAPRASQSSASSQQPSGASSAHAQLKRLVARVVEEAAALPALARYAAEPTTTSEASTYEDLLASAILNKVIERYQTDGSGGRSSGIHSASASPTPSERSSPRCLNSTRDITPPLREEDEISDWEEGATDETLELPRRVPFPEFGGDIVHNTDTEERDFDEVSCSDIHAVDGTWEENWLFQKKKIKTLHSVPVPMLVPNPNTDYKALIGDRDADDTTDLSDNASDDEGEYKSDIKRVLDSKHVIGGKPKMKDIMDYEPDSLTIIDDLVESDDEDDDRVDECVQNRRDYIANNAMNGTVRDVSENSKDSVLIMGWDSGPVSKTEFALKEEIHRKLMNGNAEHYEASLITSTNEQVDHDVVDGFSNNKDSTNTLSRHEKEGEYEETVSVPVQRYADSLRRKHFDVEELQIPTRDTDKDEDLMPGTIAYRERKKWLNAVDMPNNPYSPEAIQRRLSAKSTSSLFDITTSSRDHLDDDRSVKSEDILEKRDREYKKQEVARDEDVNQNKMMQLNLNNITVNEDRSKSPSPRILKDVLAEEVPQYKRYGRDYYIKEAKKSAGGKKTFSETSSVSSMPKTMSMSLDNFDAEFASTGSLIKQFNTIATNQQYTKFLMKDEKQDSITTSSKNNKSTVWIEYDNVNEQTLFSAQPALVDEETDRKFEEILQSAYNTEVIEKYETVMPASPSLEDSFISSSSLDDSIKIYNVQSGKVVKSKEADTLSRYNAVDNDIDTADKSAAGDNEHRSQNTTTSVSDESLVIIDSLKYEHLNTISELDEILPQLPKVKELAKKFLSMENLTEIETKPQPPRRRKSKETILNDRTGNKTAEKPKPQYMHSLTARSISREFREELKLSMATPLTNPGGSKEVPNGEVAKESSSPGSPVPEPGTTKLRLAFFESLRSKLSSK